jgi:hypothetical protein
MDGNIERRKGTYPSGRKYYLCSGKNNTCTMASRTGIYCIACSDGKSEKTKRKEVHDNHTEEHKEYMADNIRFMRISGNVRRLCSGMNNTCPSYSKKDGLCQGCINGIKPVKLGKLEKDEIREINGVRYKLYGTQNRSLCKHVAEDGTLCVKTSRKDGLCYDHHDVYNKCTYMDDAGVKCDKQKEGTTQFCLQHKEKQ